MELKWCLDSFTLSDRSLLVFFYCSRLFQRQTFSDLRWAKGAQSFVRPKRKTPHQVLLKCCQLRLFSATSIWISQNMNIITYNTLLKVERFFVFIESSKLSRYSRYSLKLSDIKEALWDFFIEIWTRFADNIFIFYLENILLLPARICSILEVLLISD